jgi:hypothetical protein
VHLPEQVIYELGDPAFAGPSHAIASKQTAPVTAPAAAPTVPESPGRAAPQSRPASRSYLTARGAMLAMFVVFLVVSLAAGWLGLTVLAGIGYAAGCGFAPLAVGRRALLHVVVAPPAIFLVTVVITQVLTAQGSTRHGKALSVLEGTLLTLAAVAPWLFAGSALGAGLAWTRGLRVCVRQLRAEIRGEITGS